MERERNEFINELYEKEHARLHRIAQRLTANEQDALDLVQNTFMLALFSYQDILTYRSPGAWLIKTMYNISNNERRLLRRKLEVPLELALGLSAEEPISSLDEIFPKKLREKDRAILRLRYEMQLSHREIGNCIGASEGACRTYVSRALERCRKFLMEELENPED